MICMVQSLAKDNAKLYSENYYFFRALFLLPGGRQSCKPFADCNLLLRFIGVQTNLKKHPTVSLPHRLFTGLHFCLILSQDVDYTVGFILSKCTSDMPRVFTAKQKSYKRLLTGMDCKQLIY